MFGSKGFKKKNQELESKVDKVEDDVSVEAVESLVGSSVAGDNPAFSVMTMKETTLQEYLYRLRLMRPEMVVRSVTFQYKVITSIYALSLLLFLSGIYVVWQKNIGVDVVYQRIDGVSVKLPNDPRSRVLLTKVIQDAKIQNPEKIYRLNVDKESRSGN